MTTAPGDAQGASASAPASIVVERRIEWSDTDASGFHHNTATFRLFETAEGLLLERLGIRDDIYGRHPRVRLEAEFLRPLRFGDLLEVAVEVRGLGRTSVTYGFELRHEGDVAVRGTAVAVLLDRPGGTPQAWSPEHRRRLESGGEQRSERLRG